MVAVNHTVMLRTHRSEEIMGCARPAVIEVGYIVAETGAAGPERLSAWPVFRRERESLCSAGAHVVWTTGAALGRTVPRTCWKLALVRRTGVVRRLGDWVSPRCQPPD